MQPNIAIPLNQAHHLMIIAMIIVMIIVITIGKGECLYPIIRI